jgi:hypothetical protein
MPAWRLHGIGVIPGDKQRTRKGATMFSSTLKRSAATLGVVAGLLSVAVPAAMAAGPTAGNAGHASSGVHTAASTQQGIIMRDGGICDPIRHMGC